MASATNTEDATGESKRNKPPEIDKLFRICVKYGGSDLHLKAGLPPMIRHKGSIRQIDMPAIPPRDMERICMAILDQRKRDVFERDGGVDFAYVLLDGEEETRFRVNMFKQRGRLGVVARRVNNVILPFEGLYLPPILGELALIHQGLIILAGITGSGKSTTIASMLNYVNQNRRCHILTIEDPIEYLFKDDKAVINQREVYVDVASWEIALKHAVREDPDVILVGEMRDQETFLAGVHAAETGHLVYGTIHASTSPSTIGRILDLFPPEMHHAIRQALAFNLRGIIAQKLIKTTEHWQAQGVSRVPINEILIINASVRKAISEGEDNRLADLIKACENEGMQDFTKSLVDRVEADMISRESAFEVAPSPDALKMALKGIKLPVSGLA